MNTEEKVLAQRLWVKNDTHTMIKNLQQRYSMPLAAAEVLEKELKEFFANTDHLDDGQEYFTAIDWQEPAGKPLRDCCTHRIKLTVRNRGDLGIRSDHGLTGYFKNAIPRICWQALEQNTLLTQEDIAFLLNTSRATVKRICKKLKQEGFYLPTRGNYHDIGPGTSHKYEAVKLHIKGLEPSEIAQRMGHSLNAIERYISDFSLVVAASEEDYNAVAISRFTAISEKVVREYLVLYDRFWLNPEIKPFLEKLVTDFKERKLLKKSINDKKTENE